MKTDVALPRRRLAGHLSNVFGFERNEHGHFVFSITGHDLTGAQEIEGLTAAGFRISDTAISCLTSTNADSYDRLQRLVPGRQSYVVTLMPTKIFKNDRNRVTDELRHLGLWHYGYHIPLGGIMPLLRQTVSDKQMAEMGFEYIAAPHVPIGCSIVHGPAVFASYRDNNESCLGAYIVYPSRDRWKNNGAFAFLVPENWAWQSNYLPNS